MRACRIIYTRTRKFRQNEVDQNDTAVYGVGLGLGCTHAARRLSPKQVNTRGYEDGRQLATLDLVTLKYSNNIYISHRVEAYP